MLTYQDYKGYGIRYSSITGNTTIDDMGFVFKTFDKKGEQEGLRLAKEFIDSIT